jgi:hypothetical protein
MTAMDGGNAIRIVWSNPCLLVRLDSRMHASEEDLRGCHPE